jgi:hypothetical protein
MGRRRGVPLARHRDRGLFHSSLAWLTIQRYFVPPRVRTPGPSQRRKADAALQGAPTARPLRSYPFPLPRPLPNAAWTPRLPPGSVFSFDRRWSIFLRPLSCFCFATRTPICGGQNLSIRGGLQGPGRVLLLPRVCVASPCQHAWPGRGRPAAGPPDAGPSNGYQQPRSRLGSTLPSPTVSRGGPNAWSYRCAACQRR